MDDGGTRTLRPLAAGVVVVVAIAVVLGLVAIVGGPLFRAADAPVAPSLAPPAIQLAYTVGVPGGPAPTDEELAAVAEVMTRRLASTGAMFEVRTVPPDRVVIGIAVPADLDREIDALLAPVGRLAIVPLGDAPVAAGQAVDPAIVPVVEGGQIIEAVPGTGQTGERSITLGLDADATAAFGTWSRAHVGEFLAITLDGRALTVPVLNDAIEDGRIEISSGGDGLTSADIDRLATIVRSGELPLPVTRAGAAP